jgi:hypothetical protein
VLDFFALIVELNLWRSSSNTFKLSRFAHTCMDELQVYERFITDKHRPVRGWYRESVNVSAIHLMIEPFLCLLK